MESTEDKVEMSFSTLVNKMKRIGARDFAAETALG